MLVGLLMNVRNSNFPALVAYLQADVDMDESFGTDGPAPFRVDIFIAGNSTSAPHPFALVNGVVSNGGVNATLIVKVDDIQTGGIGLSDIPLGPSIVLITLKPSAIDPDISNLIPADLIDGDPCDPGL